MALELNGEQGIAVAAELKTRLIEALGSGGPLCLRFDEETELDVTSLQLLYAAQQEAARRAVAFMLAAPIPERAQAVIDAAGMTSLLPAGKEN